MPLSKTAHLSIMFTDIKGFTARTSRFTRQEINELLRTHDSLLRPIFAEYHGRVVKTVGDAFLVVFQNPTDAVFCGLKIQEDLRSHNQTAPKKDQLQVRVVVNCGEVQIIDDDVFGEAVNLTARLEKIAEPGAVYFTQNVYLSMNRNEFSAHKIGEFYFKGIPEKIAVYKTGKKPLNLKLPVKSNFLTKFIFKIVKEAWGIAKFVLIAAVILAVILFFFKRTRPQEYYSFIYQIQLFTGINLDSLFFSIFP